MKKAIHLFFVATPNGEATFLSRVARGLAAALSLATILTTSSALAATPVAVWEGDFKDTVKGNYTLDANGNDVASDGSSITISANQGVTVSGGDSVTSMILVQYSNLSWTGASKPISLLVHKDNNNDNRTGICVNSSGSLHGIWQGGDWNNPGSTLTPVGQDVSVVMACGADAQHTGGSYVGTKAIYRGEDGNATQVYYKDNLRGTGDGNVVKAWAIGGPYSGTALLPATGMRIEGIAVFDTWLSDAEIAAFKWPSEVALYKPFLANFADRIMTITSSGNANDNVDLGGAATFALFDPSTGSDTTTTFTGNQNTTALPGQTAQDLAWKGWASNQANKYSAPGLVMRFPEYVSGRSITVGGSFAPYTVGGLIVEAGASSGDIVPSWTHASGNRYTELGDMRAADGVPTFFVLRDSFAINRGDNNAVSAGVQLYGDITFDIAKDKYFDCNTSRSNGKIELKSGAIFRMAGEGVFKVTTLTATGAVALDYSAQGTRENDTPFIDGNLTTDASTKFIFPVFGEGVASLPLCSGDLAATDGVYEITVGGETFFARLMFDTSAKTVSYERVGANEIVVDADTTWATIEATAGYIDDLPVELTLSKDVRIAFSAAMTKTVPQLTIKGGHTATFVLGDYVPTFANGVVLDGDSTYECEIGSGNLFGTALTIPVGETYTIIGGTEAAVDWAGKLTVNGTLKTQGKIDFSSPQNTIADSGLLEVVGGTLALSGANQGLNGTLTVVAGAELVAQSDDFVSYADNHHPVINVKGTLTFADNIRWTLGESKDRPNNNITVNLFAGCSLSGNGNSGAGAFQLNNVRAIVNGVAVEGQVTASLGAVVGFSKTSTWNIAENVTIDLCGTSVNGAAITVNGPGALKISSDCTSQNTWTINETGKLVLAANGAVKTASVSGSGAVEITGGAYTNVFAAGFTGTKTVSGGELVLSAGYEGAVTVTDGGTLKLSVTAEQLVAGYTATGVALPAGANIIFVTPTGEEKTGTGTTLEPSGIAWSGNGGNTNWSTPANWTTGEVPSATDEVSIPGEVSIVLAAGDVCRNLIVNGAVMLSGDLTGIGGVNILLDKTLTVAGGTLTCDVAGEGVLIVPEATTLSFSNGEDTDQTISVAITGAGTVQKLGTGATVLTHANTHTNTVVAAGTLKLGQQNCLGPWGYSTGILVKSDATLDINGIMVLSNGESYAPQFEEGATLTNSGSFSSDPKASVISKIVALGDMTIAVPEGTKVHIARHYNGQCYVELGERTITKTGLGELILGGGCIINGTGTLKINEGLVSTCHTSAGGQPRCLDGTIEVGEEATFQLRTYTGNTSFTAKKLVNNGQVVSSGTMTVTGEASGEGTFAGSLALAERCLVTPPSQGGESFAVIAQTITRDEPFTLDEVVLIDFSPLVEGEDVTVTVPGDKPFGTASVLEGTGTLIKEGEGVFTLSGVSPYEGVIDVKAGTLVVGVGTTGSETPHNGPLGKYYIDETTWTTNAIVRTGATLDLNGKADQTYGFVLEEDATLKNAAAAIGEGNRQTKYLVLDGDATVDATAAFGLHNGGNAKTILDLGDNTLIKIGTSSFDLVNTEIKGAGTINVTAGSLKTYTEPSTATEATINLESGTTLDLGANLTVKNLTGAGTITGSGKVTVTGRVDDRFKKANVTLADGATAYLVSGWMLEIGPTWTFDGNFYLDASDNVVTGFELLFKDIGEATMVSWVNADDSFDPSILKVSAHLKTLLLKNKLTVIVDAENKCLKLARAPGFLMILK